MRVFFDTEFTKLSKDAELISAGFTSEFGDEFYAEIGFNKANCSEFVINTVLPLLDAPQEQRMSSGEFILKLSDWLLELDTEIVLISDSQWDIDLLRPLFIPLGGLGKALPGLKFQLAPFLEASPRVAFETGYLEYFLRNPGKEHHALHDARALKQGLMKAEGFYVGV